MDMNDAFAGLGTKPAKKNSKKPKVVNMGKQVLPVAAPPTTKPQKGGAKQR